MCLNRKEIVSGRRRVRVDARSGLKNIVDLAEDFALLSAEVLT